MNRVANPIAWYCMQHRVYNGSLMRQITSFCALLGVAAPFALGAPHCADMLKFQAAGMKLAITKADATPAGTQRTPNPPGAPPIALPAHCRVEGVIDQRTGAEGKQYG